MSNTNKRSAAFKLHHVADAASKDDKPEWTFVGTGYQNKSSVTVLLSSDWQLVNKKSGQVLEAVAAHRDDGSEYNQCVKLVMRPTRGKAAKAA